MPCRRVTVGYAAGSDRSLILILGASGGCAGRRKPPRSVLLGRIWRHGGGIGVWECWQRWESPPDPHLDLVGRRLAAAHDCGGNGGSDARWWRWRVRSGPRRPDLAKQPLATTMTVAERRRQAAGNDDG
ncbi:hypothetical protein [Oryza sativa Japonica Group]|uniref:Uncharacterized protein P0460H02.33 n=1 Tax=Oryza sativa subsp. japonica TaxID=39947 RepID=Q94DP5_ORYSJ|nr:hypothetical protein [Oryza sativa Japonica Group]